ncbi:MAG TPA: P-loop NTPase [Gemmatimonadales bacterium]
MTPHVRTYHEVTGDDRSGLLAQVVAQRQRVTERLVNVRHAVAVMSGKGGVGKSFVTAALARELARRGRRVGVLDADLHGPTAARMLGVGRQPMEVRESGAVPATGTNGIRVMSTDLILAEDAPLKWKEPAQDGFIWRGTLEAGMLREFLGDVSWGELDFLLVDLPPGTERLAMLMELVPSLAGVVVVTIPSDASRRAVRRSLEMVRESGRPILGIVENMAGYACPDCGAVRPLFAGDAGKDIAEAAKAPVLAGIPFDAAAQQAADGGHLMASGAAAQAIAAAVDALLERLGEGGAAARPGGGA